jgi:membrane-bound serine protease (ClpP class)
MTLKEFILAAVALIVLGIAFMVAEAFFPAYGSLGVGGLITLIVGLVQRFG